MQIFFPILFAQMKKKLYLCRRKNATFIIIQPVFDCNYLKNCFLCFCQNKSMAKIVNINN